MWGVRGLLTYILSMNVRSFALFAYFAGCVVALWLPVLFILRVLAERRWTNGPIVELSPFWPQYIETLYVPFGIAVMWLCIGLYFHMTIIRRATGAREVSRHDEPRLYNALENLSIAAGLPMPRVELIETDAANAFAYGLAPSDAAVAVTRGLLRVLKDRELEAVLAHELMHIKHRDIQVHVVATILMGLVTQQADVIWVRLTQHKTPLRELFHVHPAGEHPAVTAAVQKRRLLMFIGLHVVMFSIIPIGALVSGFLAFFLLVAVAFWDRETFLPNGGYLVAIPIGAACIAGGFLAAMAYLLAAMTTGRILRSRELLADAASVELTKDAQALCSALLAVSGRDHLESVDDSTMALMISGASGGWLATHPSVDQRIAALKAVAPDLFPQLRGTLKIADPAMLRAGWESRTDLPVGACNFADGSPRPTRSTVATSTRPFGRRIDPPVARDKRASN